MNKYSKNGVKIAFLKSDGLNECHNYQTLLIRCHTSLIHRNFKVDFFFFSDGVVMVVLVQEFFVCLFG